MIFFFGGGGVGYFKEEVKLHEKCQCEEINFLYLPIQYMKKSDRSYSMNLFNQ